MWLPIIICLAAVALLLGPILLMQPSASQRRQAKLRQLAQSRGLRVHLQRPPEGANVDDPNMMPMYCLPWNEQKDVRNVWSLVKKPYTHELHASGYWDWAKAPEHYSEQQYWSSFWPLLDQLPQRVVALSSGPQGLCCYWSELGGEGLVDDIAQWLEQASATIKRHS